MLNVLEYLCYIAGAVLAVLKWLGYVNMSWIAILVIAGLPVIWGIIDLIWSFICALILKRLLK